MHFPMTVARLERLYAKQDEAEGSSDFAVAGATQEQWERLLDASAVAVPSGPAEIGEALDLAAYLASAEVGELVDCCICLHRAGHGGVTQLVALGLASGTCRHDMDASHVRPIVENVLRAMTRPGAIEGDAATTPFQESSVGRPKTFSNRAPQPSRTPPSIN